MIHDLFLTAHEIMFSLTRSQIVQNNPAGVLRAAVLEYWSNVYRKIEIFLQNLQALASPCQE